MRYWPLRQIWWCVKGHCGKFGRVGQVALKSASPQVHKLFFVAPQRKLRLSKAQLRSLLFILIDATFISYFFEWIWYGESYFTCLNWTSLRSGQFRGQKRYLPPRKTLQNAREKICVAREKNIISRTFKISGTLIVLIKLRLHSLRYKIRWWKLAFLALIVAAQCALNSLKEQLPFAHCTLVLKIAFRFCGATFLRLLWNLHMRYGPLRGMKLYI